MDCKSRQGGACLAAFAAIGLVLTWASGAVADAWVGRMLEKKEHDFGTVASGAEAVFRFPVKNLYNRDVELIGVRSSCGCAAPSLENESLQAGEVGYVVAKISTQTHTGSFQATLTLQAAWDDHGNRRTGEAAVRVHGTVRGDVVVEPDGVTFANVQQGIAHEQKVRISAEGRRDWRVKDVLSSCENLEVELSEAGRRGNRVQYEMLVRLKASAPPGFVRGQLVLVTDDEAKPRIPLIVSGRVVTEPSVAPESVFFGRVAVGKQATRKVLVRGSRPFRILLNP